jgi:hypothetical protein
MNDRFVILPPEVTGFTSVNRGTLASHGAGVSSWLIRPTRDAAPRAVTYYSVSGQMTYDQNGQHVRENRRTLLFELDLAPNNVLLFSLHDIGGRQFVA